MYQEVPFFELAGLELDEGRQQQRARSRSARSASRSSTPWATKSMVASRPESEVIALLASVSPTRGPRRRACAGPPPWWVGRPVRVWQRTPPPETTLVETVREVEAVGGRAFAVTADVTQVGDVAALIETVVGRAGRLDVAFNNAGVLGGRAPMGDLDPEAWHSVLNGNLTGAWLCTRYEIAQMRKLEGGGAIVNMASNVGAHQRLRGMGAYATTKAGVSALTRAAARDHAHEGVRINAVSPGPIATPMSLLPGETDADTPTACERRFSRAGCATEEVAAAVLWLASSESRFTVGHDLVLDGGASA